MPVPVPMPMPAQRFFRARTRCLDPFDVRSAPLGSYCFRELCHAWADDDKKVGKILDGVGFAICGPKYTTLFQFQKSRVHDSPSESNKDLRYAAIISALVRRWASKPDANGTGKEGLLEAIESWMNEANIQPGGHN
jgi:hypothetical protein